MPSKTRTLFQENDFWDLVFSLVELCLVQYCQWEHLILCGGFGFLTLGAISLSLYEFFSHLFRFSLMYPPNVTCHCRQQNASAIEFIFHYIHRIFHLFLKTWSYVNNFEILQFPVSVMTSWRVPGSTILHWDHTCSAAPKVQIFSNRVNVWFDQHGLECLVFRREDELLKQHDHASQ